MSVYGIIKVVVTAIALPQQEVKTVSPDILSEPIVEWLDCAEGPNERLHNFTEPHRRIWRDPPINSLCCFPKDGRCVRRCPSNLSGVSPDNARALFRLSSFDLSEMIRLYQ